MRPVVLVASGEFTLKSRPVRRSLEERLAHDVKFSLAQAGFKGFTVRKHTARLVVEGLRETQRAASICAEVFGVAYAAPALEVPANINDILDTLSNSAERTLRKGQTFAVRAHRSAPTPLSRRDIEIQGGTRILERLRGRGVRVNLSEPDVTVLVHLGGQTAYIYSEKIQGPGGLPLSKQWKMLGVLDAGPLTMLACYAMLRRGCVVELLVPTISTIPVFGRERQLALAGKLRNLIPRESYRAFLLNLDGMSSGFATNMPEDSWARQFSRRFAFKLAKEKHLKGVVLSDIAGDPASAMGVPLEVARGTPVFQPLVGLQMDELEDLCRHLGIAKEDLLAQVGVETSQAKSNVSERVDLDWRSVAEAVVEPILL